MSPMVIMSGIAFLGGAVARSGETPKLHERQGTYRMAVKLIVGNVTGRRAEGGARWITFCLNYQNSTDHIVVLRADGR
jgi:hypothetical protein